MTCNLSLSLAILLQRARCVSPESSAIVAINASSSPNFTNGNSRWPSPTSRLVLAPPLDYRCGCSDWWSWFKLKVQAYDALFRYTLLSVGSLLRKRSIPWMKLVNSKVKFYRFYADIYICIRFVHNFLARVHPLMSICTYVVDYINCHCI